MVMLESPSLRVRPRPEVGDRAIQQPVVVVGLVERDEVLDGVQRGGRMASRVAPDSTRSTSLGGGRIQ